MFQSTRPRGARHPHQDRRLRKKEFQSTRPRGARPYQPPAPFNVFLCFNPRARVGRDNTTCCG